MAWDLCLRVREPPPETARSSVFLLNVERTLTAQCIGAVYGVSATKDEPDWAASRRRRFSSWIAAEVLLWCRGRFSAPSSDRQGWGLQFRGRIVDPDDDRISFSNLQHVGPKDKIRTSLQSSSGFAGLAKKRLSGLGAQLSGDDSFNNIPPPFAALIPTSQYVRPEAPAAGYADLSADNWLDWRATVMPAPYFPYYFQAPISSRSDRLEEGLPTFSPQIWSNVNMEKDARSRRPSDDDDLESSDFLPTCVGNDHYDSVDEIVDPEIDRIDNDENKRLPAPVGDDDGGADLSWSENVSWKNFRSNLEALLREAAPPIKPKKAEQKKPR